MADGNPIKALEHQGYRTDRGWMGPVGQFIGDTKDVWSQRQFEDFTQKLLSERVTFENHEQSRYVTTYFVQELMRFHTDSPDQIIDVDAIFLLATNRAKEIVHRMDNGDLQFMRAKPENEEGFDEDAPPVIDERGNQKRKKGAKKVMAAELYQAERGNLTRKEMIARFMDEIGMSKAGATTYFHNNKAEFGPCKVA